MENELTQAKMKIIYILTTVFSFQFSVFSFQFSIETAQLKTEN
jgi:hypothetical protein